MEFTEENLRAKFHAVMAEHKEHLAKAAPGRERYDVLAKQIQALEAEKKKLFLEEIQPHELKAAACSNEGAAIARALKGKTGEPAAVE